MADRKAKKGIAIKIFAAIIAQSAMMAVQLLKQLSQIAYFYISPNI